MKDAYYFPHDSNAKDDPKCMMLIDQLGLEGYGIYWVLIETLRDQPEYNYPLALLPSLARRYLTSAQKIEVVVKNFGLFTITEDDLFLSESLTRRMNYINEKRRKLSEAGKKGRQKQLAQRNSGHPQALPEPSPGKKRKEKESKLKEIKKNRSIEEESILSTDFIKSDTHPLNSKINKEIEDFFNNHAFSAFNDLGKYYKIGDYDEFIERVWLRFEEKVKFWKEGGMFKNETWDILISRCLIDDGKQINN